MNKFKVGDLVKLMGNSGYYEITRIDTKLTQNIANNFSYVPTKGAKIGDEIAPMYWLKKVYCKNGRKIKNPYEILSFYKEDSIFLAKDSIKEHIKLAHENMIKTQKTLHKLEEIANIFGVT